MIRQHYERLKKRPNQRRGVGLSNNYLNKHLDAYNQLGDYLRQIGKLLLPPLDLGTEPEEDRITAILTVREVGLLYETTRLRYRLGKNDRGPAYHEAMQYILSPKELQRLYRAYAVVIRHEPGQIIPPQERYLLSRQRNKVMVGLLVNQGLRV